MTPSILHFPELSSYFLVTKHFTCTSIPVFPSNLNLRSINSSETFYKSDNLYFIIHLIKKYRFSWKLCKSRLSKIGTLKNIVKSLDVGGVSRDSNKCIKSMNNYSPIHLGCNAFLIYWAYWHTASGEYFTNIYVISIGTMNKTQKSM